MKAVVFGGNGWIGGYFVPLLESAGFHVILPPTDLRADDDARVEDFLVSEQPTHVVSLVGRTHGPGFSTIDYLEQPGRLPENVRDNLYAPLVLATICQKLSIHFTYLGTGCIFSEDDPPSKAYREDDRPNFFGSSYSIVKGFTDRLMHHYPNTLNVRIRMPITSDMSSRNFITKITSYSKICSIPNSMTVLPSLLPIMADMMKEKRTGTINLVNPGIISHNEILEMYKELVDPSFTWQNFTIAEQDQILLSKRSNNQLSTEKLQEWYPNVPTIHDAVRACLRERL
jgi:dTDP-4-dehydrorhamnose reductase